MIVVALYDWKAEILSFMKDDAMKEILYFETEAQAKMAILSHGVKSNEMRQALASGEVQLIHEGEKWYPNEN